MTLTERTLLPPLVFFDLFDYPLTSMEVWRLQVESRKSKVERYADVVAMLEDLEKEGIIESGNGFWFLKGRRGLIETRNRRHVLAYRKWRKAMRMVRILRCFPFIRMIGVANTLAYDNAADASDIDFFIITSRGRVWSARLFVVSFLMLFGLRPHGAKRRDTICTCFFVDESDLSLERCLLPQTDAPDLPFAYWFSMIWPVLDSDGAYQKLWDANVGWLTRMLPNAESIMPNEFRRVVPVPRAQYMSERIAALVPERLARRLQEWWFPEAIRKENNRGVGVMTSDTMIKLHVRDPRAAQREALLARMKTIT